MLRLTNDRPVDATFHKVLINDGGRQNIPILTGMGVRNTGPLILTFSPLISNGK